MKKLLRTTRDMLLFILLALWNLTIYQTFSIHSVSRLLIPEFKLRCNEVKSRPKSASGLPE